MSGGETGGGGPGSGGTGSAPAAGPRRGAELPALARATLAADLGLPAAAPSAGAWLERPGACFVTLEIDGRLRGCIGSLTPHRRLADDVRENARAAAFRDPRFPALTAEELPRVQIEVSVLGPLERLDWRDEEELLARLRPGVDGLLIEHGERRGTFLPAVWRHYPEPRDFLRQLQRKARLPDGRLEPEVAVYRYRVEHWREAEA